MKRTINTKTTKAELIDILNDDKCVIEELKADVDGLTGANEKLTNAVIERDEVIYNLRLYLSWLRKKDKKLFAEMEETFSGMPGYIVVKVPAPKKGAKK